ncbi:MAG: endonuclease [Bacteroidales bacterium]|jgi:endonuclease I|nr:endonuclease [Bacteroidales bacterium]NLM93164.1 T9SS type A sorting domain-containing protein [Bacteroidales bacterium]
MLRSSFRKNSRLLLILIMVLASVRVIAAGSITLSTSSLPHFRGVYPGQFSDVQFYYVQASGISQDLTITVNGPFKVSLDCMDQFSSSLTLSPSNGNISSKRIYVRFFPESTGQKQGTLTHQAGDAGPSTISLSGQGISTTIPTGYYNSATGQGSQLKTQLFMIINDQQPQTYSSLWSHFRDSDATFTAKVWDMYSDKPCQEPPYVFTFGEDQDTGSGGNVEGQYYNREHSVPQSWFESAMPMYTDMFHIFPTDKMVNGKRGNYPYGEVSNPSWTSQNGSKLGPNTTGGYSGTAFEPIDAYKGDIARGYFYMATRYEDDFPSWQGNGNASEVFENREFPGLKAWALEMFLAWHTQDPVSQKEIIRNQAIYEAQGNRNPFIDHPEFAYRIWDENYVSVSNPGLNKNFQLYPNPASDWIILEAPEGARSLDVYSLQGARILSRDLVGGANRINTGDLEPGLYLLILNTVRETYHKKMLIQ